MEMTQNERQRLESLGDDLEMTARVHKNSLSEKQRKEMFAVAWDVKQLARKNTASENV